MQVVLVCHQKNHSLNVRRSLKSQKKSLKCVIFRFQGRSRWSMLVSLESLSAVLVMIRSKSMSICNHSRARLVNSSRNCTFWRGGGTQIWCHCTEDSLNLGGRKLVLKSTFNAGNFIPRLSWSISSDFGAVHSWNVCDSLKSWKIH